MGTGSPNWQPGRLAWVDLEVDGDDDDQRPDQSRRAATAFDYMQHTGDPHPAAAFPTWSHDGNTIVYVSVACPNPGQRTAAARRTGASTRAPRISTRFPTRTRRAARRRRSRARRRRDNEEYYPAFSPDDKLIAFTRVPAGQEMYANPNAEMCVVPHQAGGGRRQRLGGQRSAQRAAARPSPGVNNHWPKWSPDRATSAASTYYWLIFSSNRYGLPTGHDDRRTARRNTVQVSQLYITAVGRRTRSASTTVPGDLSVEPAAEPAEHDARLGELPHSDRRRLSRSSALAVRPSRHPRRGSWQHSARATGHGVPDQTQGAGRQGDSPHRARAAPHARSRRRAIATGRRRSACTTSGRGSSGRGRRWR